MTKKHSTANSERLLKKQVIATIKKYKGQPLPRGRVFCNLHRFSEKKMIQIFGSCWFTEAKRHAGLAIKEPMTRELLWLHYSRLITSAGAPSAHQWNQKKVYSLTAIKKKFGWGWREMPFHFQQHCQQTGQFKDKLKYLFTETTKPGYVYLIKNGSEYKLGQSKDPRARRNNLAAVMTKGGHLLHKIATDDMDGIENYWKARFQIVHLHKENYKLRREHIAAFLNRKFM